MLHDALGSAGCWHGQCTWVAPQLAARPDAAQRIHLAHWVALPLTRSAACTFLAPIAPPLPPLVSIPTRSGRRFWRTCLWTPGGTSCGRCRRLTHGAACAACGDGLQGDTAARAAAPWQLHPPRATACAVAPCCRRQPRFVSSGGLAAASTCSAPVHPLGLSVATSALRPLLPCSNPGAAILDLELPAGCCGGASEDMLRRAEEVSTRLSAGPGVGARS